MTCIHGLDEINCPLCRISKHTSPENVVKINNVRHNPLKPKNPFYTDFLSQEKNIKHRVKGDNTLELNKINEINRSPFIKEIPNFSNKMFSKRMNEIDLGNPDKHGVSKKISLENPEWKIESEEKTQS